MKTIQLITIICLTMSGIVFILFAITNVITSALNNKDDKWSRTIANYSGILTILLGLLLVLIMVL